ncbi:MAG TPA: carboxylesterase family protein [Actinoplanes sp.]|jgi:para-nitrobenzyl esterase
MRPTPTGEHVVVETPAGAVRGFWRDGSAAFLGIPFAEPPYGERRFQAPVPRAPWSGVRDALTYASTPQRKALAEITTIPEPSIPGDDILTLNVFTPRPSDHGDPLPVLVYIHGGGYVAGSPASPWYDGAAFNRDGVVTVTVSYRLGFDGFGWLPGAPANRGVLDWVLALEWVRDTIGRFGGDPRRVTIAGQSAGGGAVMTLFTLPRARGLFSGAVSISGVPTDVPPAIAQRTTEQLAERLGIKPDREGFAGVPETDLIAAQGGGMNPPAGEPGADDLIAIMRDMYGRLRHGPVVDGELHPWTVEEGLRAGAGRDVPLLVGATRQEFGGLAHANRRLFADRELAELLDRMGVEPAVASRFAEALPGHDPADVLGQYVTDRVFRRRIVEWLDLRRDATNTWAYDFAWRSSVSGVAEHCLDVPFLFDLLEDPDVTRVAGPDAPQTLADRVHSAYVRFVRDGDPGWPPYAQGDSVMVFDTEPTVVTGGYTSARTLV